MTPTQRFPHAAVVLVAIMLALSCAGCSDDTVTEPNQPLAAQPPTLPDPARLSIDLGFFDGGASKAIGQENFFNAYLRAVVVAAVTDLILVPPVTAFALAVNTVPTPQPDGSWIWVYTYVRQDREAQIRLRGRVVGDVVQWSLRVSAPSEGIVDELWFDGTTRDDGDTGAWTFYDFSLMGKPAVAEVRWDHADGRQVLGLTSLYGENEGDTLTFTHHGDLCRIDVDDASTDEVWFIRWNEADGTGSLQVPDYRGGQESCWDQDQYDVDCAR
jgi:hypothetical protein